MPLADLLAKAGDADFLRSVAEAVLQMLMEADVEGLIGAGRHERTGERLNYRNGFRDRTLDTRLGALQLRIRKLRQGSYFPPFLEPRKTFEKVLVAVIQEARIGGVSTRRVDDLVQAMGLIGGLAPPYAAMMPAPVTVVVVLPLAGGQQPSEPQPAVLPVLAGAQHAKSPAAERWAAGLSAQKPDPPACLFDHRLIQSLDQAVPVGLFERCHVAKQLDSMIRPTGGAVTVLDASRVHDHTQRQAQRVGQQVPLAALGRLAVEDARAWVGLAPLLLRSASTSVAAIACHTPSRWKPRKML